MQMEKRLDKLKKSKAKDSQTKAKVTKVGITSVHYENEKMLLV